MAYIRKRGNQLVIAQGKRIDGKVEQQILFTIYSKAEALKILKDIDGSRPEHFKNFLKEEFPAIKFNWKKIYEGIQNNMDILPDLYNYKLQRVQTDFRKKLYGFTKQIILNDPQSFLSSAQLISENQFELEFIREIIDFRLMTKDQAPNEWNKDNPFYWKLTFGSKVGLNDAEEIAVVYFKKKEYERSSAAFKLLVNCFSDYAEGYNYLGLIALEQNEMDKAIHYFEKTMAVGQKLFPKNIPKKDYWDILSTRPYMRGLRNLILCLIKVKRYGEALPLIERLEHRCGDIHYAEHYKSEIPDSMIK